MNGPFKKITIQGEIPSANFVIDVTSSQYIDYSMSTIASLVCARL